MNAPAFEGRGSMSAHALFVGESIDLKPLESSERMATSPLVVRAGERGCAVLLRYGAVVLFDLSPVEEAHFLRYLRPLVPEPFAIPETEVVQLKRAAHGEERVEEGVIWLRDFAVERLQTVAIVLAKSVVLGHYEASVSKVFDRVEPLAVTLQRRGRAGRRGKELLRHIGGNLLVQYKMVGRAEVTEKPEILWEHPELERLYQRMADEYELRERHAALERKLELIYRSAETLLELLHSKRTLRVEWYIVILIVVEVLLTLYEMFVA